MSSNRADSSDPRGLKLMLRALRHRNYRLYFAGQGISLIGTWMQSVALSWLVYRLTGSAFLLGAVGFTGQIPALVLMPFGGVLADRLQRRRILIVTQSLAMVQAFVLAALVLTHLIQVWHILLLSMFLGIVNAFDAPTRQSFVVEMTPNREDLANAIALNSSVFNGARLVGPSIAGVLIVAVGEGVCFLLNGISYIAVIACLFAMRIAPRQAASQGRAVWEGLKEGFSYGFGFLPIRYILMLISLGSLVGMPYVILMPVFARTVLHGGPQTLGLLAASAGAGAITGALFLASRRTVLGLERWIALASGTFGVGLIAFSFSRYLWLSAPLVVVAGFGMMVQMASSNTIIQTIVDEDKRGRVMSLYTMAFMGVAPFGSLLAGSLASKIGPQHTVMLGGAAVILGSVTFASRLPKLRQQIRPIYARLGILPEVASGVQAATELAVPPES